MRRASAGAVWSVGLRDVQVAVVFDGRDDSGADAARLTGPLPVRLADASSPELTSRSWCASMDQCSRARRVFAPARADV